MGTSTVEGAVAMMVAVLQYLISFFFFLFSSFSSVFYLL